MDRKTIKARLKEIKRLDEEERDHAAAHGGADDLYRDFVKYISKCPGVPVIIRSEAKLVLTVEDTDAPRWFA